MNVGISATQVVNADDGPSASDGLSCLEDNDNMRRMLILLGLVCLIVDLLLDQQTV